MSLMEFFTSNLRWRNHIVLTIFSLVVTWLVLIFSNEPVADIFSIASAYLCLLLLTAVLILGPLQVVLFKVRRQVNNYLRRDVGLWVALMGLVHLILATKLSMTSEYVDKFVKMPTDGLSESLRMSLFLWGSLIAYIIGLLLILLVILSNDRVLKKIGRKWWKRLQRSAYLVFVLTIIHGLIFQIVESRSLILVGLLLITPLLALVLQTIGFITVRKLQN